MNSKSLLALMLAGTLCLTACVKDIESDSVAKVRDAKAQELASITALNNANAEAATLLANAEAALMAAETKAKEAEAEKIAAETEILKIQAELAAIELQIAEVRLEQEKIELEKKKAELEALLVEVEAQKAEAELRKAEAAAELERLAIEVEAATLRAQTELLRAQMEYNQAAADLDNDNLITLANNYYNVAQDLYTAQGELAQAKIALAAAENGLTDLQETKAERIIECQQEIAKKELELAILKTKEGESLEELRAEELKAYETLLNARMASEEALTAYNEILNEFYEITGDLPRYEYPYNLTRFGVFDDIQAEDYYDRYHETWHTRYYYNTADGSKVVLFTGHSIREGESLYPDVIPVAPDYPEVAWEEWYRTYPFKPLYIVRAQADKDAYDKLISDSKAALEKKYTYKKSLKEPELEFTRNELKVLETKLNDIEPLVEEYNKAYEDAVTELIAALGAWDILKSECYAYIAEQYNSADLEISELKRELDAANNALTELSDAYYSNYGYNADMNGVEEARVKALIRNQEKLVAQASVKLDETKKNTPLETSEERVAKAKAALEAQEEVVSTKKAAIESAEDALHAAELQNIIEPSTANQTAVDNARAAVTKAADEYNAELAKVAPLEAELQAAEAEHEQLAAAIAAAEQELADAEEKLAGYELQMEELHAVVAANESYTALSSEFTAATETLALAESEDEKLQEYTAAIVEAETRFYTALAVSYAAEEALDETIERYDYNDLVSEYNSESEQLKYIEEYLAKLDEEYASEVAEMEETEALFASAFAAEATYTAAIDKALGLDKERFEAYKVRVDADMAEAVAEAEYEALESAITAEETYGLEAKIAELETDIAELKAEIENVLEIENQEMLVEYTRTVVEALEAQVKVLEQKVAEAKAALDAATAEVTE